jgi:chloramphenicol 3-O phosphotransferase
LNRTARIVLLNGVGSAGKTSVARALQGITADPFLYVAMDVFLEMMPESSFGHPDGLSFETVVEDGKPSVVIREGPLSRRTFRGMRHAIAAMAGQGNDMIVDEVILDAAVAAEYEALLAPYALHRIGVFAPLDVLEERERRRGDREIGLARWQFDRVHRGMTYDLELDTSRATPLDCAEAIKDRFGL